MSGGRPPTPNVERPSCPLGHEGKIQLSGHVRGRAGLYDRPRFRCMPKSGGTPHKFQPDLRVRHELHGARIECDGCERPLGRRDGTRVGSGFEFAVREMADALVRVGQGSSYREASFAVRMRAKKRRVRSAIPIKNGLISDDPSLVMNYLDAFAEIVIGEVAEMVWPAYLALDALPLRVRVHQPQLLARNLRKKKAWPAVLKKRTHPRKVYKIRSNATIRERGRILVAVGSNTIFGRPRPILARFAGGGDEESWVEFLRALPGVPAWVVSDRDGAIEAAVKRVWPAGTVVHYFSEFHLAKNAGDAARADKVPFGNPMRELLEDIQADPTIYPDAEIFAAQRGFVRLTKWLADNRELICGEQPAKRAAFPNAPRSNGAVEATIEKIKTAVKGRAHLFGNADRLDRTLALIAAEISGKASEVGYGRLLRAWFTANRGGLGVLDWRAIRDRPGRSSIDELVREAGRRQRASRRLRHGTKNAIRYRVRRATYAAQRQAIGLPPAPYGRGRTTTKPQGSVAGKTVFDFPWLVAEWDWAKNPKRPEDVKAGTGEEVAWKCAAGPDHEWSSQVRSRTIRGTGCPYCAGRAVAPSMSLAATHPEIAAEWHPTRNNGRLPTEFTFGQHFVAVWQCPKSQTHIYPTRISTRTSMLSGCPDCARLANKGGKARTRSKPVAASVPPASGAPAGGTTPGDASPEAASA